jgi:hypothetical protein
MNSFLKNKERCLPFIWIIMAFLIIVSTLTSAQVQYKPLRGITQPGGVVQASSLPQSTGSLSHITGIHILGHFYSPSVEKYMQEQKASSNVRPSQEQDNSQFKLNNKQLKLGGQSAAPGPMSVSDVLNANFQGITSTGYIPPDPVIAVGPSYVVVAVNLSYAVYNKSGTKISQTDFSTFFGSRANNLNLADPKVIFDQYSQRFVMLVLGYNANINKSVYLIAASQSSDPTLSWNKYSSDATVDGTNSTTNGADFPGLGYDNQAVYITSNQYSNYTNGYFQYAKIRIFNKSQLYSNQT